MPEFGGLVKHENNQHALVPPETECGCPSGGEIKNSHIRYPSYGGTQKKKKKKKASVRDLVQACCNGAKFELSWIRSCQENATFSLTFSDAIL